MAEGVEELVAGLEKRLYLCEHRLSALESEHIPHRLSTLEVTVDNIHRDVQKIQETCEKTQAAILSNGSQMKTIMWIFMGLTALVTAISGFVT